MRVHADELALLLHIGDDIVDGDFRSGAGSGGNRNNRNAFVLRGGNALQRAHIGKLGVGDDDADRLSRYP